MEKIYMEEEQRELQNKQQRKRVWDVSVVLSFVVAAFALVSLVAFGMSNIQGTGVSYAAPDDSAFTKDTFNFYKVGRVDAKTGAGGTAFPVSLLASDANGTNPVFCIEHTVPIPQEPYPVQYKKYQDIDDYGFLYILNNSMVNGQEILTDLNINPAYKKYIESYATQVAIWLYQNKKNPGNSVHTITDTDMEIIRNATVYYIDRNGEYYGEVEVGGVFGKIESLVDKAKEASSSRLLTVSKADGEISKTDDGKYYQSTLITVVGTPADFLQSYDISLTGVDGAFAVDENGDQLKSLTRVPKGTKFYVRVPVDKVSQTVQELKVNVTGHFNTLAGSLYQAVNSTVAQQKVVSVTGDTKDVVQGVSVEFVGAPDTGMNKAQTIYFVGLIVLLCGVGIVYANAKPVKNEQ